MNIYLLYQGDAWLSTSSLELIGVFSSLEKASNHLHKKREELGLTQEQLNQFNEIQQTQGYEINYYCEIQELDPND